MALKLKFSNIGNIEWMNIYWPLLLDSATAFYQVEWQLDRILLK